MTLPITFLNPDSDSAREALACALQTIPAGVPVVGLVLKVVPTSDGGEQLVNYEFADPDLIRSLCLVLSDCTDAGNPPKTRE